MRLLIALLIALFSTGRADLWAAQQHVPAEIELAALRTMARSMPLGARIRAQTLNGKRITGTLMAVTDDAVLIKRNTRVPEPAVTVPFTSLGRLELQSGEGVTAARIIGIGLAAGAGAILTLFAFMAAFAD